MVCLIKSKYTKELAEYTQLFGDEDVAYAVLCMNNGFTLDKTQQGELSLLYSDLLKLCNGNTSLAIIEKAKCYTPSFLNWFGDWINDPENASKVVDKNGEPLVVYHGSKSILNVFDPSKSESRQYLSQQIKPTNFFSSDKTVADFFALTENQSLAIQISRSIDTILDAFAGEDVDKDVLDDEIWTEAAKKTGKSKEFVKDFWENKVPEEYKKYDEFGITKMEDPDINKYKYNVFLNMKSPIILDAKGEMADRFIEANKEVLNNNDEVIIININETVGKKDTATDYLVRNPNQIKSATENTGAYSNENNDIRFLKKVSLATRLFNFYNTYVKLRKRSIEKAENIKESNSRINRLSNKSRLLNFRFSDIFKEIFGISYDKVSNYNSDDYNILLNLSKDLYIEKLNEEIKLLNFPFINEQSIKDAIENIENGYNKVEDYSTNMQSILNKIGIYEDAAEIPNLSKAKSLKQYNALRKIKYKKSLDAKIKNEVISEFRKMSIKYHLETIKMYLGSSKNAFDNLKLKVLDEYEYRLLLHGVKDKKLKTVYKQLQEAAELIDEEDSKKSLINDILEIQKVKNVSEALDLLYLKKPEYRNFIDYVKNSKYYDKIAVQVYNNSNDADILNQILGHNSFGFNHNTHEYSDIISIGQNSFGYRTLMHEIVHAFTTIALTVKDSNGNNKFNDDIQYIIDYCNKFYDNGNVNLMGAKVRFDDSLNYGFTNTHEFIAEFFSNPMFLELLKQTPAIPQADIKANNLFENVINAIIKFFKEAFGANNNLYEQIKPFMYSVIDFQQLLHEDNLIIYNPNGIYTELQNYNQEKTIDSITTDLFKLLNLISLDRDKAVKYAEDNALNNGLFDDDINDHIRNNIRNAARTQFNNTKLVEYIVDAQNTIALRYGATLNQNGYYECKNLSGNKKIFIEHTINSLSKKTFDNYVLDNSDVEYKLISPIKDDNSIVSAIYTSIYNGDLSTLDKTLARDYVRLFWNSDLIQAGLKCFDDGNKKVVLLEKLLVDAITDPNILERSLNLKILEYIKNFWNELSELAKLAFSRNYTQQEKNLIIQAIQSAMMCQEDLQLSEGLSQIYKIDEGSFLNSESLKKVDKDIISDIKTGTLTRIRSQLARSVKNTKLVNDLKNQLEIMESKNDESIEDTYNIIYQFLNRADIDIYKTLNFINSIKGTDISSWDSNKITFVQLDLIGYYKGLFDKLYELMNNKDSAIYKYNNIKKQGDYEDISNKLNNVISKLNALQNDYIQNTVKPYTRYVLYNFIDLSDSVIDKEQAKIKMDKWIDQNTKYGDLAAGEVMVGMASRSKSSLIRAIDNIISSVDNEKGRVVLKRGNELVRVYNKIRPTGSQISPLNFQKNFMELDRDGIPTGYLARSVNYGQFFKDKDAFLDKLNLKYGILMDDDGNLIFPEEDTTNENSVFNKYYDELDDWLGKHCLRRYKVEYYKLKRRILSPKTVLALLLILKLIDLLVKDAIDEDGYFDIMKLNNTQRNRLEILRKEKRNLANHYMFTTDSDGILHVEEKVGESAKIANELYKWNLFLNGKVKYKINYDKFEKIKQKYIDKYGENSEEFKNFMNNNTVWKISDEFWQLLTTGAKLTDPEIIELTKRYNEILNYVKNSEGYTTPNLNAFGYGINQDTSAWKELLRIELELSNLKGDKRKEKTDDSVDFKDIATSLPVLDNTDHIPYAIHLSNMWKQLIQSDLSNNTIFNQLFTYVDRKGNRRLLRAFNYIGPINYKVKIGEKEYTLLKQYPTSLYSEIDENSSYVNELYDSSNPESMLPNTSGDNDYTNHKFAEMMQNENYKLFYDLVLKTMNEANSIIPYGGRDREFLLPQITGRTLSVLGRSITSKELFNTMGYVLKDNFTGRWSELDSDANTNMDLPTRPDGSLVKNIPIRFVKRLQNPAIISSDIIGSVMLYYEMAVNYDLKSKILPKLEIIQQAIDPQNSSAGKLKKLYEKLLNMMDMRMYGRELTLSMDDKKMSAGSKAALQSAKRFRKLASLAMLAFNATTVEIGYLDAVCSTIADTVGGKYITGRDFLFGLMTVLTHIPKMIGSLGNLVVNDKLVAAMLYNQISKSNSEIFGKSDASKFTRFLNKYFTMGGYTLADYMINTMTLAAVYHHQRLVVNPITGLKKFMSKNEVIKNFAKLGIDENTAKRIYKKSEVTLWDAYIEKDGYLVQKEEYKQYIPKSLEDLIKNKITDRTHVYNGVIPESDKAKMQLNVWLSYISLMRNFYINAYWEKFNTGIDFMKDDNRNVTWKTEYKKDDMGYISFQTGEECGAVFKDFCRAISKQIINLKYLITGSDLNKLTEPQKYALRKVSTELSMVVGLAFLAFGSTIFAFKGEGGDDDKGKDEFGNKITNNKQAWSLNLTDVKDSEGNIQHKNLIEYDTSIMKDRFEKWLTWKFTLLSTRLFTERTTMYWPGTIADLISSPSTAYSYVKDLGTCWDWILDVFEFNGGDIRKPIRSGAYKGMSHGTRDILKLAASTGIDNLMRNWSVDGLKTTYNYYRKLSPTSSFIPSKSEYNEKNKLDDNNEFDGVGF